MNYNFVEIGQRIRQERKKARISQESLCAEIGISRNTLSDYESGKNFNITNMSLETLLNLCRVFKCDVGYLLGEYKERRHTAAEICSAMEISEGAANKLLALYGQNPDYEFSSEEKEIVFPESATPISYILESNHFVCLLERTWDCIMLHSRNKSRVEDIIKAKYRDLPMDKEMKKNSQEYEKESLEKDFQNLAIFNMQRVAAEIAEDIILKIQREGGNGFNKT